MVSNPSKAVPPHLEDGEISVEEKNKANANHKTYSIRDNPLIVNPPAGVRPVSAKVRKVLAWSKRLAIREARQKTKDDRFRSERREYRPPSRPRRFHPSRRYNDYRHNDSRPDYHRPTDLTHDEIDYNDDGLDQPPPKVLNDRQAPHRRYQEEPKYAPPDDKSTYPPSDQRQQHHRQSVYSEPRRSFQLDRQSLYPFDRQSEHPPVYHEPRRSSYPPEASFPSRLPPTRHPHPPNLVPNYPPSHYHSHPPPPGQPPNVQEQPVYEYEAVNHPSFSTQQPPRASQPPTIPVEYNSHHSHQSPAEVYYPPHVQHSPPLPSPSHEHRPENHPPYYARESSEAHRQAFHPTPERSFQEPCPAHPPHSQLAMATRFVSNYPVPPARYELHQSPPPPSTSLDGVQTSQPESERTAPTVPHQSASIEYESNPYQHNAPYAHLEKDRLWRPEEGTRWENETMRVDPYHQHERPPQPFSRGEGPPLVPLEPSKQSHFYPSHENDDRVLRGSNPTIAKNPHEQQSQWYPIDDNNYVSQKKEAQEIMVRLITWGVTADYLLSIGISESLVRTMYTR